MERSGGQLSRDARVVIGTPFGLAPLWLFSQGRKDSLLRDLERLGRDVIEARPERLTAEAIDGIVRSPAVKPDTIRRAHGPALLALARRPEVLARHRSLWPLTAPEALLDDLGLDLRVGRSWPVATLALVGAFDPPGLVAAGPPPRPRRREVSR
jgi:hypothetical protein